VSVKVRGYKDINGVLINQTKHWLLLKYIPVDYVVDGLLFVNKQHVIRFGEGLHIGLVEKVLMLKQVDFHEKSPLDMSSNQALYSNLLSSGQLVQISLGDEDVVYIGQVIKVNNNSIRCRMVGVKGEWTNEQSFRYTSIRMLGLHNDYVESLTLLVNSEH
jgi:hypothetical protein